MESKKRLLELKSEFNKITGYRFNEQKLLYFYILPMNNWETEF